MEISLWMVRLSFFAAYVSAFLLGYIRVVWKYDAGDHEKECLPLDFFDLLVVLAFSAIAALTLDALTIINGEIDIEDHTFYVVIAAIVYLAISLFGYLVGLTIRELLASREKRS